MSYSGSFERRRTLPERQALIRDKQQGIRPARPTPNNPITVGPLVRAEAVPDRAMVNRSEIDHWLKISKQLYASAHVEGQVLCLYYWLDGQWEVVHGRTLLYRGKDLSRAIVAFNDAGTDEAVKFKVGA
jgi:hypothetical protein